MTWLQLHGLGKSYGSAVACEHVDLTVVRGEFLTLLGASGCGKSTILRMIAGLATPDYGRIVLDGKDLTGIPVHRREAAMVFQSYALFPHLTVAQNVAFGLEARGLDRKIVSEKVKATLATVELGGLAERYPRQL
ncbi:ATP-binding cassette domain-containing protein, partial [Aestuariivirga sp.]|uniref:ABC transporter ATP-binding protein n=1 Tax=Aestuariivirga sp. TaxID=2650926 RepID=UPI0030181DA6